MSNIGKRMLISIEHNTKQKTDTFDPSREASTIALEKAIFVDTMGLQVAKSEAMAYSCKSVLARVSPEAMAQMESEAVALVSDLNTGDNRRRMNKSRIDDLSLDLPLPVWFGTMFCIGFLFAIVPPGVVLVSLSLVASHNANPIIVKIEE